MLAVLEQDKSPTPMASGHPREPLLTLKGVTKRFPGVLALNAVELEVRAGEVHVLLGENGAGKSTLINVVSGTFPPDEGDFTFAGQAMDGLTPHRARLLGISPVFQEFSLAPNLTVEENLFLGREVSRFGVLDRAAMRDKAREIIAELAFDLDPRRPVGTLSRAHQQMVEIAKALLGNVRLLILDEPTASLTEAETEKLFSLVERLKADGVGIIYVSHRLREIVRLADRITVLRDGAYVATVDAKGVTEDDLVELMTGRKVDVLFPAIPHAPGAPLVQTQGLTLANRSVQNVNFVARAGEITGIAGLVGCGKSELVRALYGLEMIESGEVSLDGEAFIPTSPSRALKAGICYFPSDRVSEGLALGRPIRENASMAALNEPDVSRRGVLRGGSEKSFIQSAVDRLSLRPANIESAVGNLSGGNRQKVMLARGLTRNTRIYLFDEPTVGIDVGAKVEVYEFMKTLVTQGAAVVLVSSELPEVLHLSNRVYVMHRSQMIAELGGADITEQQVLSCFFQDDDASPKAEETP